MDGPDPYVTLGESESYFRVDDLLALAGVLDELMQREEV